jgi:hypothetical protein
MTAPRLIVLGAILAASAARAGTYASHPPMRPLPVASSRPPGAGPAYYVDPAHGDDGAAGTQAKPWRTIQHGVARLKPGDTLVLRGGVYFEAVTIGASGTADAPITIRSAPGEVAIVDGGLPEFEQSPKTAWQPVKGGADGEYESTATYPTISEAAGKVRGVWVLGNFADSMVPLHGYRFVGDLRSDNPYWTLSDNVSPDQAIYDGPGLWLDWTTHRIRARLAPTRIAALGDDNYRGATDPRTLALVVGVDRSALRLEQAKHVRVQDLVLRGSAIATVRVDDGDDVELDGVTIYGGSPALAVRSTAHFRLVRSALRGVAAPWSSRASLKYRGASPYLFIAESQAPQSHDWELAYDEFTDGHDGLVIDSVKTLRLHHDRIDNFDDDGLYLALPPRDSVPEDVWIYENVVSRVYTTLAFAEAEDHKPNAIGPGVYVFRNVFDLRTGTFGWPPKRADDPTPLLAQGRMCGDHGSPTWEPLFFYENTVLSAGPAYRDYYGVMLVMGTRGTVRRIFDDIFVQVDGDPGLVVPSPGDDLQIDGNLLWGVTSGPSVQGDFFARARPGAHDLFADPRFVDLRGGDLRLGANSPAIDAGVAIPSSWPDTLRASDRGAPDIGALPAGAPMLTVGPAAAPAPTATTATSAAPAKPAKPAKRRR